MKITQLSPIYSVSEQITSKDVATLAEMGVDLIICNRPDNEAADQESFASISDAAKAKGIDALLLDFSGSEFTEAQVDTLSGVLQKYEKVHAYCRTGNRCTLIWKAAMQKKEPESVAKKKPQALASKKYDVVVIGAGSAGIGAISSLLKRNKGIRIAVIDPSEVHYYQPGWTMVGGGVFDIESTKRKTKDLIPRKVSWVQQKVTGITPDNNLVTLDNGETIAYQQLIVAPGLIIQWDAIEGLEETLGKNGVTSNYRYDLAPYTWELVKNLKKGTAIFTQPPMPIKCAGAPQKALYLSSDHWFKHNLINDINVHFYNTGAVVFGVDAYVPALRSHMEKYNANLHFGHQLVKVNGSAKKAWFKNINNDEVIETTFDMLHVCPQQKAPSFIQESALADEAGWLNVDQYTLQHKHFENIWGAGDIMNTPNAKTMAAARKQVVVVAENITAALRDNPLQAKYDGYGSCPLTVEKGKIVLAEFGYDGKLLPTFPSWLINGTKPTKLAWLLKSKVLPMLYWQGMLKGREWMAKSNAS